MNRGKSHSGVDEAGATSHRAELEFLEAVNRAAPPQDPELLFLLMAQYANANLQAKGAEFFRERLQAFGPRLTDSQKALYLSAIGMLQAQSTRAVPRLRRIRHVKETMATLEEARQLSGGQIFAVNWIAGVVHAQLPVLFHTREAAKQELTWCADNLDQAPHAGWLREVYYQLGNLALAEGDPAKAHDYLRRSGYADFTKSITLMTPFAEELTLGHTFSQPRIAEIVPKRVYVLSGFDFSEHHFVLSENGRELIGIDAGTTPDAARTAYEALRAYAPSLPELTTVFITHSHWDHIGGHAFFRSLAPRVCFYARSNYREELARELDAPLVFTKQFFGDRFNMDEVRNFNPDVTIDRLTELRIGGTRFELLPVPGGETPDAMFIHLPDQKLMFVGDFIMPYIGAPFVNEGDLQGLLDAIDIAVEKQPRHLLHGHEPLTRNFASTAILAELKADLIWLREQVLTAIRRGDENAAIQEANFIPPELLTHQPGAQLPYLLLREHVIDRLYQQNVGYWQADLQGINHISRADQAEILADYLGVSERQFVKAVRRMVADGKYELAASLLESSGSRFAPSEALAQAGRLVYLKLMEKHQNTDPFKFILFAARAGEQVPHISPVEPGHK